MWGFGGKNYWGRKERERRGVGIVVIFAWMSSEEKHVKKYVDLYYSLGWISLVCHPQFLNIFFPDKATLLALEVLNVLVKELKVRPCPVVFASFSGGPKACMYRVLQIIDGNCTGQRNLEDYRIVRDCTVGHIYDSCPAELTFDLVARFVLHPSILGMSNPPRLATWVVNSIVSGFDTLFHSKFESQVAEYWQTLYSSVSMGAPYLVLCSEDDDLASCQIICNFAQRVQELGGDVCLVKWNSSPHVAHYQHHPVEYKAAVAALLEKASTVYSQRNGQLEREKMMGLEMGGGYGVILEPQRKAAAAACSHDGMNMLSVDFDQDPFLTYGLSGCHRGGGVSSAHGMAHQRKRISPPPEPALRISMLMAVFSVRFFLTYVSPKMSSVGISPQRQALQIKGFPYPLRRRHPIRCMLRSRL
ncbi:hypothetical protein Dimus_025650 [Dionaea muscipula]